MGQQGPRGYYSHTTDWQPHANHVPLKVEGVCDQHGCIIAWGQRHRPTGEVPLWKLSSQTSQNRGTPDPDFQYGFFLGLNLHFDIFARRNGPSVTVRRIFEIVHCPINLGGVSNESNLNGISCAPCDQAVNKGLVPIYYKYFVRNLTLPHFLLSPKVQNTLISINHTGSQCRHNQNNNKVASRLASRNTRIFQNIPGHRQCHHVYANAHVRHLEA